MGEGIGVVGDNSAADKVGRNSGDVRNKGSDIPGDGGVRVGDGWIGEVDDRVRGSGRLAVENSEWVSKGEEGNGEGGYGLEMYGAETPLEDVRLVFRDLDAYLYNLKQKEFTSQS